MNDDYKKNDTPVFPEEQGVQPSAPRQPEIDETLKDSIGTKPESETVQSEETPVQPESIPVQPEEASVQQESVPETSEIPYQQQPEPAQQPEQVQPQSAPNLQYSSTGAYSRPYGAYPQNQPYNSNGVPVQPYGGYTQNGRNQGGPQQYSQYSPYGTQQYQPYNGSQYGGPPPKQPQKNKGNKGLKVFFAVLVSVVVLAVVFILVGYFGGRENNIQDTTGTAVDTTVNAPIVETQSSPSSSSDIPDGSTKELTSVQIAAKVKPSVVSIVVYSNSSGSASSEGTGILWKQDADGYTYIITCAHVIKGSALSYTVQTEDGTQYDAERVGFDSKTDLGILKIKATGLSLAEFGDSGALQVGDAVYAVGNPGGTDFFGSFTSGVVSAIDRSVKSTYTMVCIQHDAAINPGNSGGPLVNSYGQVVGINSLKIINTEYEGMGFAIPIKSAQSIINSLAEHGYIPDRPKLGITYAEAIDYQQYSMIVKIKGLPSGSLIITDIGEESDLVNTDAKQYDMIIAVNGKDMTTSDVLIDIIENGKVGDKIKLTLCRIDNNYKTTQFDVEVKLVEDKGNAGEETTTSTYINPYDFFNGLY